ncbi:MAG: efflux RND transporter periplasmic adaptor subunit [Acidobacteriota bacterium]
MDSRRLDLPTTPHRPAPLLVRTALIAMAILVTACVASGQAATDGDRAGDHPSSSAAEEQNGGTPADDSASSDPDEQAVPVEVVTLTTGEMEAVLSFSANLEADDHVAVFSQAPGQRRIVELLVEEGDAVRAGQALAKLQDEEQRNAVAKVESQLGKAERNYERQKRLFEGELISEQVFLDARYEMEQLEIALDEARRELGYMSVRAPIDGTVTRRLVNLGDTVSINQHVVDIVDFDSLVARIYVPEKNLRRLRTGQTARLRSDALATDYQGRIERVSPIVDPKSGTVKVTIAVGRRPGLRPGLFMDVDLITEVHAEALRLPKRALVYDRDRTFVYRLTTDDRVEKLPVLARLSDGDYIEPAEHLEAGDRVVVAGQAGLSDGSLVVLPETREATDSAPSTAARLSRPAS